MAKSGSRRKCDSKKAQKIHVRQKSNQKLRQDRARWKNINHSPKRAIPPELEKWAKEMGFPIHFSTGDVR
jgi:hypothetical protein